MTLQLTAVKYLFTKFPIHVIVPVVVGIFHCVLLSIPFAISSYGVSEDGLDDKQNQGCGCAIQ